MIFIRRHRLPLRTAQRQVNQVLKSVRDDLDIQIIPRWNQEGTKAHASGSGFKAILLNRPPVVKIKVELGLLLFPFKGKIQERVQFYMNQHLPELAQGRTDDTSTRSADRDP